MPIQIEEFNEKGVEAKRAGSFNGTMTKDIMSLIKEDETSAYSLNEVAEVAKVDLEDKDAVKILMNVLYSLRITKNVINMRVIDNVKYYAIEKNPQPKVKITKTTKTVTETVEKPVDDIVDDESEEDSEEDLDADEDADGDSDEDEDDNKE